MRDGEMLEWLKRHAWKACKLQKGFRGSNPRLSARGIRINPASKGAKDFENKNNKYNLNSKIFIS